MSYDLIDRFIGRMEIEVDSDVSDKMEFLCDNKRCIIESINDTKVRLKVEDDIIESDDIEELAGFIESVSDNKTSAIDELVDELRMKFKRE